MSWAGFRRHRGGGCADVYVGSRRVQWRDAAGGHGHQSVGDPKDLAAAARAAVERFTPRKSIEVRLWLSGGLCPALLDAPVDGVEHDDERVRLLQARLVDEGWFSRAPAVWLERGTPLQPRLAAAVDRVVVQGLVASLASLPAKVRSIRPWWSEPLRVFSRAVPAGVSGALAVADCDSLTVLAGSAEAYARAATQPCASGTEALLEWQRQRIGLALAEASPCRAIHLGQGIAAVPAAGEFAAMAFADCTEPLR